MWVWVWVWVWLSPGRSSERRRLRHSTDGFRYFGPTCDAVSFIEGLRLPETTTNRMASASQSDGGDGNDEDATGSPKEELSLQPLCAGGIAQIQPPQHGVTVAESLTTLTLPPHANAADWLLDLLNDADVAKIVAGAWEARRRRRAVPLTSSRGSGDAAHFTGDAPRGDAVVRANSSTHMAGTGRYSRRSSHSSRSSSNRVGAVRQCCVLMHRAHLQQRGQLFDFVSGLSAVLTAVVAGLIWWQSESVDSLAGALFFVIINQSLAALITVGRLFPPQRDLMRRETSLGFVYECVCVCVR